MSSVPESRIDLSAIRALSKEGRQLLAQDIRKDSELWNAVNGMGGLSENSEKSLLQGTITNNREIVPGASITITSKSGDEIITKSNQRGYYSVELNPDSYTVIIRSGEYASEDISVETKKGVTSTLDYDFKEGEVKETAPVQ